MARPLLSALLCVFLLLTTGQALGDSETSTPQASTSIPPTQTPLAPTPEATQSPLEDPSNPASAPPFSQVLGSLPPLTEVFEPCQIQVATGRSGALKVLAALPGEVLTSHIELCGTPAYWAPVDPEDDALKIVSAGIPTTAPSTPGAYRLVLGEEDIQEDAPILFVLLPFEQKSGSTIESYRLGHWPGEGGGASSYPLPIGFIKVTEAVSTVSLSQRLTVRQFITKNQHGVWPKYMLIDLRLIDKLELIAQDLRAQGLPGKRIYIMSGFRTPEYNAPGVGKGGRASNSRHIYGDASDMWVDDDGNARLDDMNGDGKIDTGDVRVLLEAQTRVETTWPELVGGGGIYRANAVHGPFLHVDVRGHVARWGAK